MKYLSYFLSVILLISCVAETSESNVQLPTNGPIQLHPANPHYFLYKGKTLALITSAEHYGAMLNLDFDYKAYLKTLGNDGMNYTRIFTGSYFEIPGESFGIQKNTLAPDPERVITPWIKMEEGYDLTKWNNAYFERLKDFMQTAETHKVIVEVTLFSSIYRDEHWDICPQNPENNINIDHEITRFDAQTMNNGELYKHQENFVRKMVNELNEFDNFFFEIQNEPWSDHSVPVYNIVNKEELRKNDWTFKADFADQAALDWQEKLAGVIVEEEEKLPKKHLIAQNYVNFKAPIPQVSDHISIINFHYAWPEAAKWNYHYNKVLGFDESGFAGSDDTVYRRQAWRFMLSGGGLFNNLDYSFYVGKEDGTGENDAPGGGGTKLRKQLKTLNDFLHSFELEKLKPNQTVIQSSAGLIPYILSDGDNTYAIYLRAIGTKSTTLKLAANTGIYNIQILNTITGEYSDPVSQEAVNGSLNINIDIPEEELALKVVKSH